jgi:hypothetical protein
LATMYPEDVWTTCVLKIISSAYHLTGDFTAQAAALRFQP